MRSYHRHELDDISSDVINATWRYLIYAISQRQYIQNLINSPHSAYNPLIDDSTSKITEQDCNNPNKSQRERQVLEQIRQEQIILSEQSRQSRQMKVIESFSLDCLLDVILRTFSHTLDISKSIISINDYIGEVTYGDEEDDEAEELLSMMFAGGDSLFPKKDNKKDNKKDGKNDGKNDDKNEPPSTGITANTEETIKLMNSIWLPPIRTSIDWSKAFSISQLVPVSSSSSARQVSMMNRMNHGFSQRDANQYNETIEEGRLEERANQFDMVSYLRGPRGF
jgi:hypothetical protein